MGSRISFVGRVMTAAAIVLFACAAAEADALESQRLQRAKDLIADESWTRAIAELTAAVADARETSRDEALFWLAHSQFQAGDSASALESIRRLEGEFARSRWVKPARSLRIEIAQRLRRTDVLWFTAVPPPPPAPPGAPAAAGATPPAPPVPATPPQPARARPSRAPGVAAPPGRVAAPMPPPPPGWLPDNYNPDIELRIQALGSLILADSEQAVKVIPLLRDIALEASSPAQARRALFALGQSNRPEARSTVVEVAKTGPEAAQLAAVRVLARLRGADVSPALFQVYTRAGEQVKVQVVSAFAERAETDFLARIAQSETNAHLRDTAIVTLGRAPGGPNHLRLLYDRAQPDTKPTIINSLFDARDEEGLIRIADRERRPALRAHARERLRLLGSPAAVEYLSRVKK